MQSCNHRQFKKLKPKIFPSFNQYQLKFIAALGLLTITSVGCSKLKFETQNGVYDSPSSTPSTNEPPTTSANPIPTAKVRYPSFINLGYDPISGEKFSYRVVPQKNQQSCIIEQSFAPPESSLCEDLLDLCVIAQAGTLDKNLDFTCQRAFAAEETLNKRMGQACDEITQSLSQNELDQINNFNIYQVYSHLFEMNSSLPATATNSAIPSLRMISLTPNCQCNYTSTNVPGLKFGLPALASHCQAHFTAFYTTAN